MCWLAFVSAWYASRLQHVHGHLSHWRIVQQRYFHTAVSAHRRRWRIWSIYIHFGFQRCQIACVEERLLGQHDDALKQNHRIIKHWWSERHGMKLDINYILIIIADIRCVIDDTVLANDWHLLILSWRQAVAAFNAIVYSGLLQCGRCRVRIKWLRLQHDESSIWCGGNGIEACWVNT